MGKPFTLNRALLLAAFVCALFAFLTAAPVGFTLLGLSVVAWGWATVVFWIGAQVA